MNRHINSADRTRRLASLALGSLAVLALAASPALAHSRISNADTVRHNLLAAELTGADAAEAADLESLLETEDANDQGENVDAVVGQDDQGDQAQTSNDNQIEVDTEDSQDNSTDTSGDSTDASGDSTDTSDDSSATETHDGGQSGSNGGADESGD